MHETISETVMHSDELTSFLPTFLFEALEQVLVGTKVEINVGRQKWAIVSLGIEKKRGFFMQFEDIHPKIGENMFNGMIVEEQLDGSYRVFADSPFLLNPQK